MLPLFVLTLFLSSMLMFVLEPMAAKMVLPLLAAHRQCGTHASCSFDHAARRLRLRSRREPTAAVLGRTPRFMS